MAILIKRKLQISPNPPKNLDELNFFFPSKCGNFSGNFPKRFLDDVAENFIYLFFSVENRPIFAIKNNLMFKRDRFGWHMAMF